MIIVPQRTCAVLKFRMFTVKNVRTTKEANHVKAMILSVVFFSKKGYFSILLKIFSILSSKSASMPMSKTERHQWAYF